LILGGTAPKSYSELDAWILPQIAFALIVRRRAQLGRGGSFFAGLCILHGAGEFVLSTHGDLGGWTLISHLLSALPVAGLAIATLSALPSQRRLPAAWGGVLLGTLIYLPGTAVNFFRSLQTVEIAPISDRAPQINTAKPAHFTSQCGSTKIEIQSNMVVSGLTANSTFQILPCGFESSYRQRPSRQWIFQNTTNRTINIHLRIPDVGNRSSGWNIMIPPHQEKISPLMNQTFPLGWALLFHSTVSKTRNPF
jgi:hypothetical protein